MLVKRNVLHNKQMLHVLSVTHIHRTLNPEP